MSQHSAATEGSDASVIRTAETYPVRYIYWPAFSLWSALFLMDMAGGLPGQAAWIERTRRALDDDLRDAITLLNDTTILHGIHGEQLARDLTSQEIPELLGWLADIEPAGVAKMLPPIEKISALSDGRARFGMDDPIADWDGVELNARQIDRLRTLVEDPDALTEFVIETLRRFWRDHLEAEFRRLQPQLRATVERGNRRTDPRTHRELVLELAGREPAGESIDGRGIERILAIPTCHVGSFLLTRHIKDPGSVLLVAFEAGRASSSDRAIAAAPTASTYRALADETRLGILRFLATGERYGAEIVSYCGLSQPTVSKHLRMLVAEGLLTVRREGGTKFYSVHPERLAQVGRGVEELGKA